MSQLTFTLTIVFVRDTERILCVGLMDVSPSTYYYILKSEGKADRTAKVYKFI